MKLGRLLIGEVDRVSFEERLFHSVMLLGIAMTMFGTVMVIYYKAAIAMDLVFVGCWGAAYCHSRFLGKYAAVVAVSSAILVFAFIPYLWITSGGSGTIIPIYLIAFIAYLCTVTKGRFRVAMVTSMMVVTLFLLARDTYLAGSVFAAIPTRMTFFDFSIQLCVIMAAVAVLVIVYSNAFAREKARSEAYGKTVEEQYRQQFYYMQNLEKLNFRLKSERHDFNNHLGVMYALLEGDDALKEKSMQGNFCKRRGIIRTSSIFPTPRCAPCSTTSYPSRGRRGSRCGWMLRWKRISPSMNLILRSCWAICWTMQPRRARTAMHSCATSR